MPRSREVWHITKKKISLKKEAENDRDDIISKQRPYRYLYILQLYMLKKIMNIIRKEMGG